MLTQVYTAEPTLQWRQPAFAVRTSIHSKVFLTNVGVPHVGAPLICLCENEYPCKSLRAALVVSLCFHSRGSLRAFCLEDTSEGPICSKCSRVLVLVLASGPFASIPRWQKMPANVREHLSCSSLFIYFHDGGSFGSSGMSESVALSTR